VCFLNDETHTKMEKQIKKFFLRVASKSQGEVLIWQFYSRFQALPVKARTRIVFAAGRDVLMAGDVRYRVVPVQGLAQPTQLLVLGVLEHIAFQAFEFDADRVVIALGASSVLGLAGMPGPVVGADKLPQAAVATDIKM
jgi:hypothetical protein